MVHPVQIVGASVSQGNLMRIDLRLLALAFLLTGELLLLTIRYDAAYATRSSQWIRLLMDHVSAVPQVLAVVLTATLIFGGSQIAAAWKSVSVRVLEHRGWLGWLAVHLICFICFGLVTHYVLEVNQTASGAWYAFWLISSGVTALSWCAAVVHPSAWPGVFVSLSRPVGAGFLVGLGAWAGGLWARQHWGPLASATFSSVTVLLKISGVEVVQNLSELMIGTSRFSVRIAPQCSGYEGMGLAIVFVGTYLWWCRADHYFPRSLLLIPASIALMFVANSLRIAALIMIGHFGWEEFAVGGFHSQAGWLAFNVVTLGLLVCARLSPYLCRVDQRIAETESRQSVPMLMPFVVLTLTIMACGALQHGFDWLYPVRLISVALVFALVVGRFSAGVWTWTFHWMAPCLGVAVYAIWIALEPDGDTGSRGALIELFETARRESPVLMIFWLAFRVIGSVVTVPLAEEFAFRGYLLPWLSSPTGDKTSDGEFRWSWFGLLLSSVAFGALHPGRFVAGTLAGCLFGLAYYRRSLLMDAVVAHATTNLLVALHVLVFRDWNLWS